MNILITGSGLLAKACTALLQRNHGCTVVSRSIGFFTDYPSSQTEYFFHLVDLYDEETVKQVLIERKIEIVIHLAREKFIQNSDESSQISNNLAMTIRLLNAMHSSGVRKLIFASSGAVYGTSSAKLFSEKTPPSPTTENGKDKLAIEQFLLKFQQTHTNFSIIVLRFFNLVTSAKLLSLSALSTSQNSLITKIASAFANNHQLKLAGNFQRDYLDYVDAARAIEQSIIQLPKISEMLHINIGSGISTSAMDLMKIFERISGRLIEFDIEHPLSSPNSSVADISLARQLLGFSPSVSLTDICRAHYLSFCDV